MTQVNNEFTVFLKRSGLSITKQRLTVFKLLEGHEPLPMAELYELAKDDLDRASLYRTISIFEGLGIVRRVNTGWKYRIELSDTFSEHHHHLTCLKCHKIIPISEQELESFVGRVSAKYAFKPVEHQIEIQGYCKDCSKEQ